VESPSSFGLFFTFEYIKMIVNLSKIGINFLAWLVTFLMAAYIVPSIHIFNLNPKPINLEEIADGRLLAAQVLGMILIIVFILLSNARILRKSGNLSAQDEIKQNSAKAVGLMFLDEMASILLNFGSIAICIAMFAQNPWFILVMIACYASFLYLS
jgi:hypothetical protein